MQKLISKYALAAHLALMAVAPLVLFPFCADGTLATVLLWLSLFGATWLFMEPSRRADEMLHEARARVAGAVARDPLFWFFVFLLAFAVIRWTNGGVGEGYDVATTTWFVKEASSPMMPSSMDGCGGLPFATTLATMVIVMGCRHALGKGARISFLFTSATLAGLAGALHLVLLATDSETVKAMAACSIDESSFVGAGFCIQFIFGLLAMTGSIILRWRFSVPWVGLMLGGTAAGALFFSTRITLLVFAGVALMTIFAGLIYASRSRVAFAPLKFFSMLVYGLLVVTVGVLALQERGVKAGALSFLKDGKPMVFEPGYQESRKVVSDVARRVWSSHRWLGTGLGSFELDLQFNAVEKDWESVSSVQKRSPNGWWHILVERGIVGVTVLAILPCFLLWTWIMRFANACRRRFSSQGEGGFLSVTDPVCWIAPLIVGALVADAFFSASLLRPEIVMAGTAAFALSASSFPLIRRREDSIAENSEIGEASNG